MLKLLPVVNDEIGMPSLKKEMLEKNQVHKLNLNLSNGKDICMHYF